MASDASVVEIRLHAARLHRFTTFAVVALAVLLVLERFGAPFAAFAQRGLDASTLRAFGVQAIQACPQVAYLIALESTRRALAAFARGDLFAPAVARMLARLGTTLAIGAFIGVFLVPGAERALGAGPGYWIAFDVSAVVLGAIGLALSVVARVLRRACELQTELDEIF